MFIYKTPLRRQVNPLVKTGIAALEAAFEKHEELGAEGLTIITKNRFGDTAVLGDIACEEAVLQTLRNSGMGFEVISEEHGTTLIGLPQYHAILDGIDGSAVYKVARGTGRYGTMLRISPKLHPSYNDYEFCGIMEHATHTLFFAVKEGGAWKRAHGVDTRISTSSHHGLAGARFYADDMYDEVFKVTIIHDSFIDKLHGFSFFPPHASCTSYADVAAGKAEFSLECTRKGNLELAVAYGIIKEAGGVMLTLDGKDLGQQSYERFGQESNIPIITAANMPLAQALMQRLASSPRARQ